MMISLCSEAGLPEPDFEERSGSIVVTLWRDWLTNELVASLALSDRQRQTINHVRMHDRIFNSEYREICGGSSEDGVA